MQRAARRRWASVTLAVAVAITLPLGMSGMATARPVTGPGSTPTRVEAAGKKTTKPAPTVTTPAAKTPMTLAEWKARYESVIGVIADDVLVAYDDGKKGGRHPTAKDVGALESDCQKMIDDSEEAPSQAPPIPSKKAEQSWTGMINASHQAGTDCLESLEKGSKKAATQYQSWLELVNAYEKDLSTELK